MKEFVTVIVIVLVLGVAGSWSVAQDPPVQTEPRWRVATKVAPPFAFRAEDDEWTGMSVELWEAIAKRLDVECDYVEFPDVARMLEAVHDGRVEIAVGAITVNADRDEHVDFTYAFSPAELGIATRATDEGWLWVARAIMTPTFLKAVATLVVVLFVVGFLLWLAERRRNAAQFNPRPLKGLGDAFWWSGVTMTTVGYGDKSPQTAAGRTIALIWMFTSIVVISGLTGAIASALTVGRLKPAVSGVDDLARVRVGVLDGSAAQTQLNDRGVRADMFASTDEGLRAVAEGRIDAFVNDAVVIEYAVRQTYAGDLVVLPETFGRGNYAFAMPKGSEEVRRVNRELLEVIDAGVLDRLWKSHLGPR